MSQPIIVPDTGGFLSRKIFPALNRLAMRVLGHSVILKDLLYRILWLLPESLREQNLVRTTLKSLAHLNEPIFFMNIGANDGLAGDPLREFIVTKGWNGILVEPVDYVFQRLVKAYRSYPPARIILENAAIAEATGTKKFWHLKQASGLSPGYDQIGSFSKDHVLKHKDMFPNLERYLVSRDVACISFGNLLRKHNIQRLDLVFIDTEGYDYEVIKQIDLVKTPPKVIIFENAHLPAEEVQACYNLLRTHGFVVSEEGCNTVATHARGFPTGSLLTN